MAKRKLEHFAEMKGFPCIFEPDNEVMTSGVHPIKGKWRTDFFKNDNPISIELGCGKGEYTVALARKYPNQNFIGADIKGARLWRGSKTVDEEGLSNAAFVRTKIEFINTFFEDGEVDEVWLTFSDPQPKDKKGTKRLTGPPFLERYRKLLKPGGTIHVKTDSVFLYERTMEEIEAGQHYILENTSNLYGSDFSTFSKDEQDILNVKTFYEEKFLSLGMPIHYISFKLNDENNQAQRKE